MNECCQFNWVRPKWEGAVTAPTNGLVGAVVSGLLLGSVTALQGGVISLVSNVASFILAKILTDDSDFDCRSFAYWSLHLVIVPLLAWGSVALGWSISIPAVVALAITNFVVAILGGEVVECVKECIPD